MKSKKYVPPKMTKQRAAMLRSVKENRVEREYVDGTTVWFLLVNEFDEKDVKVLQGKVLWTKEGIKSKAPLLNGDAWVYCRGNNHLVDRYNLFDDKQTAEWAAHNRMQEHLDALRNEAELYERKVRAQRDRASFVRNTDEDHVHHPRWDRRQKPVPFRTDRPYGVMQ